MAGTGMEWGAAAAARRRDVDREAHTIHAHGGKNRHRDRRVRVTEDWCWSIVRPHLRDVLPGARLVATSERRGASSRPAGDSRPPEATAPPSARLGAHLRGDRPQAGRRAATCQAAARACAQLGAALDHLRCLHPRDHGRAGCQSGYQSQKAGEAMLAQSCPGRDSNPHAACAAGDFKSPASTFRHPGRMEERERPLHDRSRRLPNVRERETGLEPATPTLARLCSTN
jgi:hypothetical protein